MFKVINEKPGGINLRVTGRVIIVGAADAGVGNRARSENKALLDAEALRGGDRGARQGEALVDGDGGTEIAAASRGVSDDVVEALGGPVGAVCRYISFVDFWGCPLSERGQFGGLSRH